MIKKISIVILFVLIALWQISFLQEFSIFRNYSQLILVISVIFIIFGKLKNGIWFSIIVGLILDMYSTFGFFHITIALLTAITSIHFIFKKLLSRKTIYSIIIVMFISTIIYNLSIWFTTNVFYWFNLHTMSIELNPQLLVQIIGKLIINSVLLVFLYTFIKFLINQLKTGFIVKSN